MVLPPEETVLIQLFRDVDLVASAAELSRLMQGLQVGPLVKGRFRPDQLAVDEGEQGRVAQCEGVQVRLSDQELRVPSRAWNRFDGVAYGAGDPSLRSRIVDIVVCWIVEGSTEKWHRVMTASAEPGCVNISVSLQEYLARVSNARQVGRIIEGTEFMGRLTPERMSRGVTLETGIVAHEARVADELSIDGPGERRFEVLFTL